MSLPPNAFGGLLNPPGKGKSITPPTVDTLGTEGGDIIGTEGGDLIGLD